MPYIMLNPKGGEKKKFLFLSPKSTHSIQAESKCSLIQNDNHKGKSTEHGEENKNTDLGMGDL